ncbi:MAG: hypothetical protein AAB426_03985, partial [Myxococcota bacterium]
GRRMWRAPFNADFPLSHLNPGDYYPALGAKKLRVRATDGNGLPAEGAEIRVSTVVMEQDAESGEWRETSWGSPIEGTTAGPDSSVTIGGTAEFSLLDPMLVPNKKVIATFTLQGDGSPPLTTVAEIAVRANSTVSVQDALDGTAVFTYTPETKHEALRASQIGVTPPVTLPSAMISGQQSTAHYFAKPSQRRMDSIQVMLNQVVPRNSAAMALYHRLNSTNGLAEDGYFGEATQDAIFLFRQYFGLGTATGAAVKQLQAEYGVDDTTAQDGIVDAYLLIRDVGGKYNDAHMCFGQTTAEFQIDGGCGESDGKGLNAGLFEIYENIVVRFIEGKIRAAESYVHDPDIATWRSRPFKHGTPGLVVSPTTPGSSAAPVNGAALDQLLYRLNDQRKGVSYCFGCTQLSTYAADALRASSIWSALSPAIQNNVFNPTVTDRVPPGRGQATTAEMDELTQLGVRYPGLYQTERQTWKDQGNALYAPARWAGIDCSGIIEVSSNVGVVRALASPSPDMSTEVLPVDLTAWVDPAFPQLATDLRPDLERRWGSVQGIAHGVYPLELRDDDGTLGSYDSVYLSRRSGYWAVVSSNDEDAIGDWVPAKAREENWSSVDRGDVLIKGGHVVTAYADSEGVVSVSVKLPGGKTGAQQRLKALSIEAFGMDTYMAADGRWKFGRKAIIRELHKSSWQPTVAAREVLW